MKTLRILLPTVCAALFLSSPPAGATENGLPLGHTGAFSEPSCNTAGCHRIEPLGSGTAKTRIEVGSYIPGATQPISVIIESAFANRWGYQLAARRADNPTQRAGTFESFNQFSRVRCADATAPPCANNGLEYVTHTSATPVGRGGKFTFTVNWTPPAQNVGDVVFTAAVLAADGDRGTNNDATAVTRLTSFPGPTSPPALNTGGIVSAASGNSGVNLISPLSLISVFGLRFTGPESQVTVGVLDFDARGLIPDQLNRVTLEFRRAGDINVYRARIIYVQGNQINAQAPVFPTTGGPLMAQVVINRGAGASEVRSNSIEVPMGRFSPALFTLNSSGQGEVAAVTAQGIVISGLGQISPSRRALPGETVVVFGTGFGETNTALEAGELSEGINRLNTGLTVTIGGMPLLASEIPYAGAAPGFAGLTQFNLTIPANLPPGNHEIRISSGGNVTSQPGVTIAVGGNN